MVIADDHRLILDGVRRALESDGGFEIVGETQNGTEVLDLVQQHVARPGGAGRPHARARRARRASTSCATRFPDVKVVMLSASTSPDLVETALRRGASAYVVKSVDPADLPSTLRQVASGTVFATLRRVGGEAVGRVRRPG